jgi:two-component system chemotaxis response regulator CheB
MRAPRAVVIGASAGGIAATRQLLAQLPPDFPWPLFLVQHIQATSGLDFAAVYARSPVPVLEACDKATTAPGTLYMAPAGYHLLVETDFSLSLSVDDPVCYARPSIDVLFESAADAYGAGLVAVLLTGANADGANGVAAVHRRRGRVMIQDPATAEARAMPEAGLTRVKPEFLGAPDAIGGQLAAWARGETP